MYSDAVATQHDSKLPFNARPDGSRDSGRIRVRTPERGFNIAIN
jgi:hypothetical protein